MPLPNVILYTKYRPCILLWSLVIAIYLFSINGVLWSCQWSNYAHLQYQQSYGIKKHVYQVTRISTHLFILIIYIYI